MSEQREQWPTDDIEFRMFAARVADAVMVAMSKNLTISPHRETERCCCPLGAVKISEVRENAVEAATGGWSYNFRYPGYTDNKRYSFIVGFDRYISSSVSEDSPYYRLGRAYRRWALERNR
jgi:hypothetical protein